jgi:hypothetical protein
VNTGTFQQLYAAYWAVMADQYVPTGATGQWLPAFPNPNSPTSFRMFRSPIRNAAINGSATTQPTLPALNNQQVMQLRAAIAAVNTIGLRHGSATNLASYGTNDVISRTIFLPNTTGGIPFQANVYSTERQPYLTQVYARNDPNASNAWMAIEFYNPFPTPIQLNNWVLATVGRTSSNLNPTPIGGGNLQAAAPGLTTINANEHVVLVSSNSPPTGITFSATANVRVFQCTGLSNAFGNELVLMRPRLASGNPLSSAQLNNTFTEIITTPYDLIPIDSYDFTNLPSTAATSAAVQDWWYIRPSDPGTGKQWHFVYPGPWMLPPQAGAGTPMSPPPTWSGTLATASPPPRVLSGILGVAQASTSVPAGAVLWPNYHDMALQINNVDFGGPLKPASGAAATPNTPPLGAFPRNGDILQVTYIGAYKISPLGTPTITTELNSVSADSAMATACDSTDGVNTQEPIVSQGSPQIIAENVGRFAPIDPSDASMATPPSPVNDFLPPLIGTASNPIWRYHWALRLFDFLTVQAPQDDYFPDVDPWLSDSGYPSQFRYAPATGAIPPPVPVANVTGAANAGLTSTIAGPVATGVIGTSEDTAPVDGLINVNTAPWRVLAAVPWVPATSTNWRTLNASIALQIAAYRDTGLPPGGPYTTPPHGPFKNLFELGEVPITGGGGTKLRSVLQKVGGANFSLAQGNLTPLQGGPSGVQGDFQATFNTITRISNLVTTRSDSYTAYVLVQGWRNAETANPHLVVQRRAAVILDRSGVTPTNKIPSVVYMPTQ